MNKLGVLEGILFAIGDEGVTLKAICEILDVTEEEAKNLLKELQKRYESDEYGIRISFLGNTFKLTTKKEHKEYYQKLLGTSEAQSLSPSNLEVLAIVAYNEPITRLEIDNLRGVASGYIVRKLCARGLIKTVGKSEMPGRPNLYGITSEFLDYFGLATRDDLPKIEHPEEEKQEETELFTSIYKERETLNEN